MTLYQYINRNIKQVRRLTRIGVMPVSILRHWEIYSRFDAHRKAGKTVTTSVLNTSFDMRCSESNVYKTINKMKQTVDESIHYQL